MPQKADLMGLGFSWPVAEAIGNTAVTIAGVGATQAAGATIPPNTQVVILTTTTAGAASLTFSTACALGTPIFVFNDPSSGVTGNVFPPLGGLINGASAGMTITTAKSAIFIQTTASIWRSIPSTSGQ